MDYTKFPETVGQWMLKHWGWTMPQPINTGTVLDILNIPIYLLASIILATFVVWLGQTIISLFKKSKSNEIRREN